MALLSHRRDITADAAEVFCTFCGAEATRDFLLHFHHSQISLSQVVVKRHREVSHESQSLCLVLFQSVQQILGFRLFSASALSRCKNWFKLFALKPLLQDRFVSLHKFCLCRLTQPLTTAVPCLRHALFDFQQQLFHLTRPFSLLNFFQKLQLSQVMGIAQRVKTRIAQIRTIGIVTRHSLKLWQDADSLYRLLPTLWVTLIRGQSVGRSRVQPIPFARNINPRFIKVGNFRCDYSGTDYLANFCQLGGAFSGDRLQRALRNRMRKQVLDDLTTALTGEQLSFVQIQQKAFDSLAITRSLWHRGWKLSNTFRSTTRTGFPAHPMLCDFQFQRRQIKNLPPLINHSGWRVFQTRPASNTTLRMMKEARIGIVAQPKTRALMLKLPASFLLALLSQRAGLFIETIRRWRLVAIGGVGRQTLLKLFDLSFQPFNINLLSFDDAKETFDQRDNRVKSFAIHSLDVFSSHALIKLLNQPFSRSSAFISTSG